MGRKMKIEMRQQTEYQRKKKKSEKMHFEKIKARLFKIRKSR